LELTLLECHRGGYFGGPREMAQLTDVVYDTTDTNKFEMSQLSAQIGHLMVRYCDAIQACESIPVLSLTPLFKMYAAFLIWGLCLEACIIVLPIDGMLRISRRLFGWPKIVIGRRLYEFFKRPFRSVWAGEIPIFRFSHVRSLTRLLLYYRAQLRINTLLKPYNRRHLDLFLADPQDSNALKHAEDFKKAVELFKNITTGSYQLRILTIGGPLVALLSLVVQKALLPMATWLWTTLVGPVPHSAADLEGTEFFFAVFGAISVWILVSAWMDMRLVVHQCEVRNLERDAHAYAGLKKIPEIPFDLIFCASLAAFYFGAYPAMVYRRLEALRSSDSSFLWIMSLEGGGMFIFVAGLVLTAFIRRRRVLNDAAVQLLPGPLSGIRNQRDGEPMPA
jgi:hypothetical protein